MQMWMSFDLWVSVLMKFPKMELILILISESTLQSTSDSLEWVLVLVSFTKFHYKSNFKSMLKAPKSHNRKVSITP